MCPRALTVLAALALGGGAARAALPAEAVKAVGAQDWPKAIPLLEPLAKTDTDGAATYWLGVAYAATGTDKGRAAGPLFAKVLELNPHVAQASWYIGRQRFNHNSAAPGPEPLVKYPVPNLEI